MNMHRTFPPDTRQMARFTADAYLASGELINALFDKTELLDGVIYEMPMDGPLTTRWNIAIARWLFSNLTDSYAIVPDKTLRVSEYWAPSPDFYVFDAKMDVADVTGADCLLVIEVSDDTLRYDLSEKAKAYAAGGVREYWVIDPNARCVFIHRLDGAEYGEPIRVSSEDTVEANDLPGLKLRLSDLQGLF